MRNKSVIKVKNLSKIFKLPHEKYSTAKQRFVSLVVRPKIGELKALDNISFEVKEGEFFSIIGANGSGKSTLLKLLAEIYIPTLGSVEVKDKLSPFIELGVGFNPELTARENVFLNSAILGLSKKETEGKFDEIIQFAELEKFVDQKLKNFSSGMQVRLAFSIAIQAPAKILLVDEVLAVGDAAFQHKCFGVFEDLKMKGTTIVFVSHALNVVDQFSDRVMYLKDGRMDFIGRPQKAILNYLRDNANREARTSDTDEKAKDSKKTGLIREVVLLNSKGVKTKVFQSGENIKLEIRYKTPIPIDNPIFGVALHKADIYISGPSTKAAKVSLGTIKNKGKIKVELLDPPILPGDFFISVGVFNKDTTQIYDYQEKAYRFTIIGKSGSERRGLIEIRSKWEKISEKNN